MGLLKYEERHDFTTAARYLQPALGPDGDLVQRAKEFEALNIKFQSNIRLVEQ
jgi:hypothetical protein